MTGARSTNISTWIININPVPKLAITKFQPRPTKRTLQFATNILLDSSMNLSRTRIQHFSQRFNNNVRLFGSSGTAAAIKPSSAYKRVYYQSQGSINEDSNSSSNKRRIDYGNSRNGDSTLTTNPHQYHYNGDSSAYNEGEDVQQQQDAEGFTQSRSFSHSQSNNDGHQMRKEFTSTTFTPHSHSKKANLTPEETEKLLSKYAGKKQTGLSLRRLLEFGSDQSDKTLIHAAIFLHHELPIRLAKRAVELSNLPYGLSDMGGIKEVRSWYMSSFKEILSSPIPDSIEKERKFTNMVKEIYERHSGTLWTIAKGVYELKNKRSKEARAKVIPKNDLILNVNELTSIHNVKHEMESESFSVQDEFPEVQTFLDKFFLSRVGIRVMIGQHIALHEHIDGWVGLICIETDPVEIAKSAVRSASKVCSMYYGVAPEVSIISNLDSNNIDPDSANTLDVQNQVTLSSSKGGRREDRRVFAHIPAHLHHILFELLKNSMRSVIEKKQLLLALEKARRNNITRIERPDLEYNKTQDFRMRSVREAEEKAPEVNPIRIIIDHDLETDEFVFNVVDNGLGIPEADLPKIFSYMYTTVPPKQSEELFTALQQTKSVRDFDANAQGRPIAGLGYGLPISRVFANYWGGSLQIKSNHSGSKTSSVAELQTIETLAQVRIKALGDSKEPLP